MTEKMVCDNCREDFENEPIRRGSKIYCCEACAYEASRSIDCGGRADSHITQSAVEEN